MSAIQKYGPTGYHVHLRFPVVDPLSAEVLEAVDEATEALEVVEKTPCTVRIDTVRSVVDFAFYDLPISDAEQAIFRATYVLQEALPGRGCFRDMLTANTFLVDANPLGL